MARLPRFSMFLVATAFALGAMIVPCTDAVGIATASIDLGNEWIKIGLVKPGVPMDIVLNQESKRKTAVVMSLRNNERAFSSPAEVVAVKYPKYAFSFLTELLGVQVDSQAVEEYRQRFPYHDIVPEPTRGTVMFRLDNVTYTVEELVAQIIDHAVQNAAEFAEQEISSIVITVPPYFNQAQRKAVLEVGRIANLKILQLLNANMAVAVNYGVFRQSSFNETVQNIMFYDMGSTSTIATIVGYSTVKEKGQSKPVAQAEIKGVGFDRSLGGLQWDLRLRDHLMQEFMKNKKVKGADVTKDARAMAKLFKATQKVKTVLSANKETKAQVEGLYKEIDFRAPVTREEFENMTEDLFARVAGPINRALADAKMNASDIDQIILFGGGVRIPKIQDILKDALGVEILGKSINGDEAACLGASYQAAVLSKGYRVKKFNLKDRNMFPVQVNFNRMQVDNVTNETSTIRKTNTIFPAGNPFPQRKVLTFHNFKEDFGFDINYGNLSKVVSSSTSDLNSFNSMNISSYNLSSVKEAFEGHADDEEKGVKVHFNLDLNGMVSIDKAEAVFEREPVPEPEPKSTLEKLSGWFGFGGEESDNSTNSSADATKGNTTNTSAEASGTEPNDGDAKKTAEDESPPTDDSSNSAKDTDSQESPGTESGDDVKEEATSDNTESSKEKSDGAPENKEDSGAAEDTQANAEKSEKGESTENKNDTTTAPNATNTTASKPKNKTDTNTTTKKIVIKERIVTSSQANDIQSFSDEGLAGAQGRIKELIDLETARKAREAALNDLEGSVYKNKDFMYSEDAEAVTNETQRETIMANLTAIGEWLDEDGWEANTSVLHKKLKQINDTVKSVYYRVAEASTRPEALLKLNQSLNSSNALAEYLRLNISERIKANETLWHTEKEVDDLENLINETSIWLDTKLAAQANVSAWENPAIATRHIVDKTNKLDREYYYLIKKPKPKPKKKKPSNITASDGPTIIVNGTNGTDASNATNATKTSTEDVSTDGDGETAVPDDSTKESETTEDAPDIVSEPAAETDTVDGTTTGPETVSNEKSEDEPETAKEGKGDSKTKKEKKTTKNKKKKKKKGKDEEDL